MGEVFVGCGIDFDFGIPTGHGHCHDEREGVPHGPLVAQVKRTSDAALLLLGLGGFEGVPKMFEALDPAHGRGLVFADVESVLDVLAVLYFPAKITFVVAPGVRLPQLDGFVHFLVRLQRSCFRIHGDDLYDTTDRIQGKKNRIQESDTDAGIEEGVLLERSRKA
jgi:hypothetical protein